MARGGRDQDCWGSQEALPGRQHAGGGRASKVDKKPPRRPAARPAAPTLQRRHNCRRRRARQPVAAAGGAPVEAAELVGEPGVARDLGGDGGGQCLGQLQERPGGVGKGGRGGSGVRSSVQDWLRLRLIRPAVASNQVRGPTCTSPPRRAARHSPPPAATGGLGRRRATGEVGWTRGKRGRQKQAPGAAHGPVPAHDCTVMPFQAHTPAQRPGAGCEVPTCTCSVNSRLWLYASTLLFSSAQSISSGSPPRARMADCEAVKSRMIWRGGGI
jgi:hypothetical protein